MGVYLPYMGEPFLSDDYPLVVEATVQGEPSVSRALDWFLRPAPGMDRPMPPEVQPRLWRPLWRASFAADFAIWGPNPLGFRLTSVALHGASAVLLALAITGMGVARAVAIAAAVLFAVHPLHGEAVHWVAARGGPMALAGTLAAVTLALRPGVVSQVGAGVALIVAMLAKESGLVAVPLVVGAVALRGGGWRSTAWAWGLLAVVLGFRTWILGEPVGGYPDPSADGLGEMILTLLGPARADWVGSVVPNVMVLAVVGVVGLGSWRAGQARAALGALVWLALALAPVWAFTVSRVDHGDARLLYLPSAPLCVLLALGLHGLLSRRPRLFVGAVAALTLGSCVLLTESLQRRQQAGAIATTLVPAAQAAAAAPGRTVLTELPDSTAGVHLARNAFPGALLPPFTAAAPGGRVGAFLDRPQSREALSRLEWAERVSTDIRWLRWTGAEFEPYTPKPWRR